MKYIVTINNNNYEVEVERGKATAVKTEAAAPASAAPAPAAAPPTAADAPTTPAAAQNADGEIVVAPMPGIILQIKKNTGDPIKKGEVLFVLEAMKMENEIYSPKDGTMGQIFTTVGTNVSTGAPLAAIK